MPSSLYHTGAFGLTSLRSLVPSKDPDPHHPSPCYVWVEWDWMKSWKGDTNLGQAEWEDCTEEEVLGLRTLSCLVFQEFEELT